MIRRDVRARRALILLLIKRDVRALRALISLLVEGMLGRVAPLHTCYKGRRWQQYLKELNPYFKSMNNKLCLLNQEMLKQLLKKLIRIGGLRPPLFIYLLCRAPAGGRVPRPPRSPHKLGGISGGG